jgi:uncharacterized protein (DUF4415 family)
MRPLTDEDGEVRELTAEDFKGMRPLREADPGLIEAVAEYRRKRGRPKSPAPKIYIGLRMAPDVVESLKASGPGYNARVEQALRKAGFGASKTKPAKKTEADTVRLTRNVEPAAKKREAHWKNFHAAGAGFRAHGSHGFAGAKKSAAKRSVKKNARRR